MLGIETQMVLPAVLDARCRQMMSRYSFWPQAALPALAFKWIRVLHRCWTDRVHYDEARYLLALQRRQARLLKVAASIET
jgi:hypothetical protein